MIAVTRHTTGQDLHPIQDEVLVVNDFPDAGFLFRVMLHEFGHTIRFRHLSDPAFIMYSGQPLPDRISDDEAAAAVLHQSLPVRVDLGNYGERSPVGLLGVRSALRPDGLERLRPQAFVGQ